MLLTLLLSGSTINNETEKIIVIDAGHGGMDGGCVNGQYLEKDITLKASQILTSYLENAGYRVYNTRLKDEGLAPNKTKDMHKRLKIINHKNTLLFISIHVNSFPNPSISGAQVFYGKDLPQSKKLATCIQNQFKSYNENKRFAKEIKNKFLTEYAKSTGCIVELGFISNQDDLKNLTSNALYDLCMLIYLGITDYLCL